MVIWTTCGFKKTLLFPHTFPPKWKKVCWRKIVMHQGERQVFCIAKLILFVIWLPLTNWSSGQLFWAVSGEHLYSVSINWLCCFIWEPPTQMAFRSVGVTQDLPSEKYAPLVNINQYFIYCQRGIINKNLHWWRRTWEGRLHSAKL